MLLFDLPWPQLRRVRRYSLVIYGPTNKNNYKKGCVQMYKVLVDSENNVEALTTAMRTYTEMGRDCCGGAMDLCNERVPRPSIQTTSMIN